MAVTHSQTRTASKHVTSSSRTAARLSVSANYPQRERERERDASLQLHQLVHSKRKFILIEIIVNSITTERHLATLCSKQLMLIAEYNSEVKY